MERNYLLVVHFKLTDTIQYFYYTTLIEVKEKAKELKKYGNKVLHIYKIEEVQI